MNGREVFDAALSIFLKYVPEQEIDTALSDWYHLFQGVELDGSDYYDLIEPMLRSEDGDV